MLLSAMKERLSQRQAHLLACFCGGLFLLWFLLLWHLSSKPLPDFVEPELFPHFDKVLHAGWFMGGGLLYCAGVFFAGFGFRFCALTCPLLLGLIGWLDEYHQSFVPGRAGNSFLDWSADVLGSFLALVAFFVMLRKEK